MVVKKEHDFLAWTSFPSSAKLFNDEKDRAVAEKGVWWAWWDFSPSISVSSNKTVLLKVKAKQSSVLYSKSFVLLQYYEGRDWRDMAPLQLPLGTFDWREFSVESFVPSEGVAIRLCPIGGAGSSEAPGITWFDDLKIYQDDVLIYSDDFSNWNPTIGAGVGAPIGGAVAYLIKEPLGPMVSEVVGAVVGGALGGGIGLLTGLGIISVPQIPSLGVAPEGPGAPARLGKYQITG